MTIQDLCDCGATPEGCAELLRGGREVRVDFGNDCDDHLYGDALREQIMPLDDE